VRADPNPLPPSGLPADQTVGQKRRLRLSDCGRLPYTEAFILEMFRHSAFLPFTILHRRVLRLQRRWMDKVDFEAPCSSHAGSRLVGGREMVISDL